MDQINKKHSRLNRKMILAEKRQRTTYLSNERRNQLRVPISDITNVVGNQSLPSDVSASLCEKTYGLNSNDIVNKNIGGSNSNLSTSMGAGLHVIQNRRMVQPLQRIDNVVRGNHASDKENNADDMLQSIYNGVNDNLGDIIITDGTYNNNEHEGDENDDTTIEGENTTSPSYYEDIGDPTCICEHCGAKMWIGESTRKDRSLRHPKFSMCCMKGKVQLPLLKDPPLTLYNLLLNNTDKSRHFTENIRAYNMMFSFTSMGGKIDSTVNRGRGTYVFRLHGQNYHRIGSLLPNSGSSPKFSQLYIYDTQNEVLNRIQATRSRNNSKSFDIGIVSDLKKMLDEHNPLAKSFRAARDRFDSHRNENVKLKLIGRRNSDGRTYNLPTASEVAALIVGDIGSSVEDRDVVVETKNGALKRISELHPAYLALQYPLLFPYGEDGYRIDIQRRDSGTVSSDKRSRLSLREFFAFRIQERDNEARTIVRSKKLFQQFLVDGYTMIESERLSYIRNHQKELRSGLYKNLAEAALRGNIDPSSTGKRIILPSSFTGGARYMIQNYQDAMAICKWYGYPDLFITFTCNPKWPEITRFVQRINLKPEDRPDILCRVFKIKLDQLIRDLRVHKIFGRVKAVVYTVEFQKRGLPHAHILLFLQSEDKFPNPEDIDKIVSAEIPDKKSNSELYEVVRDYMIHGPCGPSNMHSPCMRDGKCSKHFPKKIIDRTSIDEDGYPMYRRRDSGRNVEKNGILLDNRYVIPYNPRLLQKYQAHINVEWCNQSRSIKYLFKYVNKGHDRVTAAFCQENGDTERNQDEIKMYYDCRYISPCEAVWRIFGFDIHYRNPPVERLNFHLPDEQNLVFSDDAPIDSVISRPGIDQSMFLRWMECNKRYDEAKHLSYSEFPTKFVWKQQLRDWLPRKRGFSIGRIYHVPPGAGEKYYLRILLNIIKGPTCYEDLRTINGMLYSSFKDACYALGLLDDDKEYIDGIKEASYWGSANYLRLLFVMLLLSNSLSRPEHVWENTWCLLGEDILYGQRSIHQIHDDGHVKNATLAEIEKLLRSNGSTLKKYPQMPFPDEVLISEGLNRLIQDELCYDRASLAAEHENLFSSLTFEQKGIYEEIMQAVEIDKGGIFFIYGHGGTGKTFIWRTLSAAIRSVGDIVLTVASSGIASLLLPGGRTAHSRFAIPLNVSATTTCNIEPGYPLADLLIKTKLIIWDEAPMVHRYCFEALDRSLRDILRHSNHRSLQQPFGGKVVVFGGDFRQILPVIPKGSRQDIVHSTINASYLWDFCRVLKLTKNMRLEVGGSDSNADEIGEFSNWILKIGDGKAGEPNDGEATIQIPYDILISDTSDPIAAIAESTYPSLLQNLGNPDYFQDRAILAPTIEVVDMVNEYFLSLVSGEEKIYLSSDSICKTDENMGSAADLYSSDFLNGIKCSGLPNHVLKLKVGVPVMLIRNIDRSNGLCNGTRLMITQLGNHVIEAKIISGNNIGYKVFIPRMTLSPSDTTLPFKLQRRQFPLIVCFAMTINKSQGQSLSYVGLYLPRPVFSHGQFYVAISRVTRKKGLKILICDKDGRLSNVTNNVVYKEVFQNL